MIDAGHELHNLKLSLISRGMSDSDADSICARAHDNIRNAVIDIVSDALEEAARSSDEDKTHQFITEIMAVRDGAIFNVTTSSGRTNFSEPPFPMLPKLLSGAKVSSQGHRYKVIPVKTTTSGHSKANTIEKALMEINKHRAQLKAEKDARESGTVADPLSSVPDIKPDMPKVERFASKTVTSGNVNFRTASEKQDPNKKWVLPAKEADMSQALNRINVGMHDRIDAAIRSIISSYGGV